jgi:hypothetical protein
VVFFAAVAVFLAVVFFAAVFSVAVSDFAAAVLVDFFDLLLDLPPPAASLVANNSSALCKVKFSTDSSFDKIMNSGEDRQREDATLP